MGARQRRGMGLNCLFATSPRGLLIAQNRKIVGKNLEQRDERYFT